MALTYYQWVGRGGLRAAVPSARVSLRGSRGEGVCRRCRPLLFVEQPWPDFRLPAIVSRHDHNSPSCPRHRIHSSLRMFFFLSFLSYAFRDGFVMAFVVWMGTI